MLTIGKAMARGKVGKENYSVLFVWKRERSGVGRNVTREGNTHLGRSSTKESHSYVHQLRMMHGCLAAFKGNRLRPAGLGGLC